MNNYFNIDIVLPCYNPHDGWEKKMITNFNLFYKSTEGINFNLYVVSDGSQRGFSQEVKDYLYHILPSIHIIEYEKNMGKGYALRKGVKDCKSDYIIYTDYDFPYTNTSMLNVIQALKEGADVVVATRNKQYQQNLPHFRKFLSKSSHLLNRYILQLKIKDTQGGLKGFNRKGQEVFLSTTINSFLFDTEFIYKASRKNKLNVVNVDSQIKEGLAISDMGMKVLKREFLNFFKILRNK